MDTVKLGDAVEYLAEVGVMNPTVFDQGTVCEIDRDIVTIRWQTGVISIEEMAGLNEDWRIINPDTDGYYSSWFNEG